MYSEASGATPVSAVRSDELNNSWAWFLRPWERKRVDTRRLKIKVNEKHSATAAGEFDSDIHQRLRPTNAPFK